MTTTSLSLLGTNFSGRWQGLQQRVVLAAIATFVLVVGLALFWLARQPEYVPAFTGLNPSEAGQMIEKLDSAGTPYRLGAGGASVLVPLQDVDKVRINLAMEGLPADNNVGLEIFDRNSFGLSPFAEKVNFQRAMEGELARSIKSLNNVADARVHLVVPEQTLFLDNQQNATASVLLTLRPGAVPDGKTIRGIVHLVSSAIEGLDPSYVAVVDQYGRLLASGSGDDTLTTQGLDQIELVKAYENSLETQVSNMLTTVLGPGKATVSVKADMNFDQLETTIERGTGSGAQSQGGSLVTTRTTTEVYTGTQATSIGGAPGVESNVSTGTLPFAVPDGAGSYFKTDQATTYQPDRTVEHIVRAPGSISRLSVAVAVDNTDSKIAVADIQKMVSAATGIITSRGDAITVQAFPFNRSLETQQSQETLTLAKQQTQQRYVQYGIAAAAIAVMSLLVWRALREFRGPKPAYAPKAAPQVVKPAQPSALADGQAPKLAEAPVEMLPGRSPEAQQTIASYKQLVNLARSEPQAVAKVVQAWMRETEP